ncbi:hypothetical protein [Methylosinus sp. Ce-a6]|uniref:hypothetical protein n=1 Tax=Methylosinus sp. Ce-a6 TaxID=2172005 RepID=UPI001358252C|nr:hypothetical protein [Methylosinus sp. Ce-a6]
MRVSAYRKIVIGCAVYDLVATTALAVPILVPMIVSLFESLDHALRFDTNFISPDPTTIFLINLAGCSVVIWALVRLRMPSVRLGRFDALYRGMIVLCQIWAVLHGATPLLLGVSVVLLGMAALELLPVSEATEIADARSTRISA